MMHPARLRKQDDIEEPSITATVATDRESMPDSTIHKEEKRNEVVAMMHKSSLLCQVVTEKQATQPQVLLLRKSTMHRDIQVQWFHNNNRYSPLC